MEQRLIQSPQMIQAMQILQLPLLELSERIEQELVENPFLEVVEPEREERPEGGAPEERTTREERDAEAMLEVFERLEGDFGDGSRNRQPTGSPEDSDRKYEAMMNAPETAATLPESILAQLTALDLSDRERTVLEYVVWSLDERGYLTETPATLAAELTLEVQRTLGAGGAVVEAGAALALEDEDGDDGEHAHGSAADSGRGDSGRGPSNGTGHGTGEGSSAEGHATTAAHAGADEAEIDLVATEDEVRDALERLRENVHPGLGALSLSECLLLQLPQKGLWNPLMRGLIERHLDDVRTNRVPQIAKAIGEDIETIKAAIELLTGLDPSPGSGFGEVGAEVIHPEVLVELVDGEVVCRLDKERTPSLRLSPLYQTKDFKKMLKEGTKEEREWAKKRLESASWLIDAIAQRESTLLRIAKSVFLYQRGFLERGAEALMPLRMQSIGAEVGVHISTVSRAVAGKYAQTPRGIFPLKYFFVGGTTKSSGEETSQVSIKERIKKIVAKEDPAKPISDEGIAKALEDEDGITIARRTVTKYRKALGIPSSTQRRAY